MPLVNGNANPRRAKDGIGVTQVLQQVGLLWKILLALVIIGMYPVVRNRFKNNI